MRSAASTASRRMLRLPFTISVEIVDAVQEDVVERGRFRLDVARHAEIDDEHRRVASLADHALEQALADDRQRARRAGDDDVVVRQPLGQLGERDRAGAEAIGERFAALAACGWRP